MSKTVVPFTAKLVKFDTAVPFAEVISRLDIAVNKEGSGNIREKLKLVNTQDEFTALINDTIGNSGFLYFMEVKQMLLEYIDGIKKPSALVYTIGNPLIAQMILKYNIFAAYNVPLRLLILEKSDEIGTTVSYYLPSTVLGQAEGGNDPVLHAVVQDLDIKFEALAERITKPVCELIE
ncbi:hypothetical protein BYT27DRAFT_7182820 [Phlegmacium glaucopus]|nr:hypothetical protein BYT27DRAFT_7182820 [Phlegmacium glaucopus]